MFSTDSLTLMGLPINQEIGNGTDIEVYSFNGTRPSDQEIRNVCEAGARWKMVEIAEIVADFGANMVVMKEQHTVPLRFSLVDRTKPIEPFVTVFSEDGQSPALTKEWFDAAFELEIACDASAGVPIIHAGMYRPDRLALRVKPHGAKFFIRFKKRTDI